MPSDNTTPMLAKEYDVKINQTIPYYSEFYRQTLDVIEQCGFDEIYWLDLGCGTGTLEEQAFQKFPAVHFVLVDPSEKMLEQAKFKLENRSVKFVCAMSDSVKYENCFDVVTAIQSHHYMREQERKKATECVYMQMGLYGIKQTFSVDHQPYSCQFPIFIKLEKKNKIAAIYNFVGQLFKEKIKVYGENVMANPWEEIPLSDYEKHMKLGSVMQLQTLNEMMKGQFAAYPVSSIMILGIAGGNGLEHIPRDKFKTIYGVDINNSYLQTVIQRYPELNGHLECLCLNLIDETEKLPKAELLVANLLVEYIGYDCFQKAVKQVQPKYVSCIIQINIDDGWVSDSPYIHVFDKLDEVHHQVEEDLLIQALEGIGYKKIAQNEKALPNGKKLVQLDFMEM